MGLQTDDFEQPPRISRAFARFGKSGKGCEAGRVAFERPQNVFGSTSNSLTRKSFSKKNLDSDDHFERPFSFMAMKGNYRIRKNMNKTLVEETARACRFP
jgi:hypothetical protein